MTLESAPPGPITKLLPGFKVARNSFFCRSGAFNNPHKKEKRHHRRHKIGKGNLPAAAVMAVAVTLFLL